MNVISIMEDAIIPVSILMVAIIVTVPLMDMN